MCPLLEITPSENADFSGREFESFGAGGPPFFSRLKTWPHRAPRAIWRKHAGEGPAVDFFEKAKVKERPKTLVKNVSKRGMDVKRKDRMEK